MLKYYDFYIQDSVFFKRPFKYHLTLHICENLYVHSARDTLERLIRIFC